MLNILSFFQPLEERRTSSASRLTPEVQKLENFSPLFLGSLASPKSSTVTYQYPRSIPLSPCQ